MLIDWLTLRLPLLCLDRVQHDLLMSCLDYVERRRPDGSLVYVKRVLDIDRLRSDSDGLFWTIGCDGKQSYLVIAGSPANIMNGCRNNVFGSLDIVYCAQLLIAHANMIFSNLPLNLDLWQCRRIDITGNYLLPDSASVELALSQLLLSNAVRKRASSPSSGGNSVYWGGTSQRARGKAYWKGQHLRFLERKGKISIPDEDKPLLDRILRFEHTRGSQFFRTFEQQNPYVRWHEYFTPDVCKALFLDYFSPLVSGTVEVQNMNSLKLVALISQKNDISEGRARSAYNTLRNIRSDGFDVVKSYMPRSTFCLHLKYLRKAGITDSDLYTAKIIPLRKVQIILAQPVTSWEELRKAA